MTSTPPNTPSSIQPRLVAVPPARPPATPVDATAPGPSDRDRIAAARRLARATETGRKVLDRLDADGVEVQLLPDREFADRHGYVQAARWRETTVRRTAEGIPELNPRTVIAMPWTTMLRPHEGAAALVHQGAHHAMDQLIEAAAALTPTSREAKATEVRDRFEAELAQRRATSDDVSVAAVQRTYGRGSLPPD